jgi:hypothetical protein
MTIGIPKYSFYAPIMKLDIKITQMKQTDMLFG